MNTIQRLGKYVMLVTVTTSLVACADWSPRQRNTATGAAIGGAAGAVISGGGLLPALGGAAVGGVVGNQIGKH